MNIDTREQKVNMADRRRKPSEYFQELFHPPRIIIHSPSDKVNNIFSIQIS